MAVGVDLAPLFDTTVKIRKRTSAHTGGYTKPGYESTSLGKTYPAHIERSQDLVRTEFGHEVVGRRKVFLYSTTAWSNVDNIPTVNDKIILPATHPPREPQITLVQPASDDAGVHHVVVWCI